MPRPARTKAASAAAARPAHRGDTRPERQIRPSSDSPEDDIYGVSDDEMQRRERAAAAQKQKKKKGPVAAVAAAAAAASDAPAQRRREESLTSDIYGVSDRELKRRASGAGKAAAPTSAPAPTSAARPQQSRALRDSRRRRDEAMSRLENITSTTAEPSAAGPSSDAAESPAVEAGRKAHGGPGTSTARRTRSGNMSGIDILDDDDEMFGGMDTTFGSENVDSPPVNSSDMSSFNIALFKRGRGRPRQSSVASREDGPIRPSSRGPNTPGLSSTFSLSNFKRRPRERSILGASRREPGQQSEAEASRVSLDVGASRSHDMTIELSPVHPELRSTIQSSSPGPRSVPAGPSATTTTTRKRKSDEGLEGPAKRRAAESDSEAHKSLGAPSLPSTPPEFGPEIHRPATPEVDPEIMAPPGSSSSSDLSPSMLPSLKSLVHVHRGRGRPRSRQQKEAPGAESDGEASSGMSSPPSLTHSPIRRPAKSRTRAPVHRDPKPVTTADLASLLPKRHRRVRDDRSDVDSDEERDSSGPESDDDDELGYGESRRVRRNRSATRTRPLGPSRSTGNLAAKANAAAAAAASSATKPYKPPRRKYGSRSSSDKENQGGSDEVVEGDSIEVSALSPLPDDTFDAPAPAHPGSDDTAGGSSSSSQNPAELKKMAKKFKEVDKWNLDFEEVTYYSSPANAR